MAGMKEVQYVPHSVTTTVGKPDYIPDPDAHHHVETVDEETNMITRLKKIPTAGGWRFKVVEVLDGVKVAAENRKKNKGPKGSERMQVTLDNLARQGADVSDYMAELNLDPNEAVAPMESSEAVTCDTCGLLFADKGTFDTHKCTPVKQE